ncbi:hypothetical protein LTR37_014083 [Vermiconidia calcicola]|uniref:Uncharacterized protein n=1 Tax=Vermiconidia calcicola TaxID=1690605 RepID=A0ACC3MUE6_9PEZI|nr:hypothetical protein LTR37_014083 [Vermiconidia calcicola]
MDHPLVDDSASESGDDRKDRDQNEEDETPVLVPGHWVTVWYHQIVCLLEPLLEIPQCRDNVLTGYGLVEEVFAALDHCTDPLTGGLMDLDADVERLLAMARSSHPTKLDHEIREQHRITVHANIADWIRSLQTQLERPIGQVDELSSWIQWAISALDQALSLDEPKLQDVASTPQKGVVAVEPSSDRGIVDTPGPSHRGRLQTIPDAPKRKKVWKHFVHNIDPKEAAHNPSAGLEDLEVARRVEDGGSAEELSDEDLDTTLRSRLGRKRAIRRKVVVESSDEDT